MKDTLSLSLVERGSGGAKSALETVSVIDADGEGRARAIECKLELEMRRLELQLAAHGKLLADQELEARGQTVAREIESITL